jgi:sulfate adenylyltransferase
MPKFRTLLLPTRSHFHAKSSNWKICIFACIIILSLSLSIYASSLFFPIKQRLAATLLRPISINHDASESVVDKLTVISEKYQQFDVKRPRDNTIDKSNDLHTASSSVNFAKRTKFEYDFLLDKELSHKAIEEALPSPHGGKLIDLLVTRERKLELEKLIADSSMFRAKSKKERDMVEINEQQRRYPIKAEWQLSPRQACDLELLLVGGFSPLVGYMSKTTYSFVRDKMKLLDNNNIDSKNSPEGYSSILWPMPLTLDIPRSLAVTLQIGDSILLRDEYYRAIAVLTIGATRTSSGSIVKHSGKFGTNNEWIWEPERFIEAKAVFGTTDLSHPGVYHLLKGSHDFYIGGAIEGLDIPLRLDYEDLRMTPRQLRNKIASYRWARTVAFQTRNPMHRAHIELARLAGRDSKAGVLIHPVVGVTKPGDVDYTVRVQCYKAMLTSTAYPDAPYFPNQGVILSLLPLAMRMAGPREALWHALIRKNFGASHFIVGRDHAGCKDANGNDFYGPYEAQDLLFRFEKSGELGISIRAYQEIQYVPLLDSYFPGNLVPYFPKDDVDEASADQKQLVLHDGVYEGDDRYKALKDQGIILTRLETKSISGTVFRAMMNAGETVPTWYSDPAVMAVLTLAMPPLHSRGFAIFFTGFSGSGKTTISAAIIARIKSLFPSRKITVLDGDVVRTQLSRGLGFTVADRNINVERIGFVAAEAVRHGGIVIAAPIAPFESSREEARRMVTSVGGGFFLIHVATSIGECAFRDVKGLYRSAGLEEAFLESPINFNKVTIDLTGVSHPYEYPQTAEIVIPTGDITVADASAAIIAKIISTGYIRKSTDGIIATEMAILDFLSRNNIKAETTLDLEKISSFPSSIIRSGVDTIFPNKQGRLQSGFKVEGISPPFFLPNTCKNPLGKIKIGSLSFFSGLPMKLSTHASELLQIKNSTHANVPLSQRIAGIHPGIIQKDEPSRILLLLTDEDDVNFNNLFTLVEESQCEKRKRTSSPIRLSNSRLEQIKTRARLIASSDESYSIFQKILIDPLFLKEQLQDNIKNSTLVKIKDIVSSEKKIKRVLTDAERTVAAYDLWTALRWSGKGCPALVVRSSLLNELIELINPLLAIDPCLLIFISTKRLDITENKLKSSDINIDTGRVIISQQ